MTKNLSELSQGSLDLKALVDGIRTENADQSKQSGLKLVRQAAEYGIGVKDYLTLAVKPSDGLNGYELFLSEMNLPMRNDYTNGITLQAASDTFQTFAGSRVVFPPFIEDVIRFANRQDQFEQIAPMLAGSRTVAGTNEIISTIVNDDSKDRDTYTVPEGSRIPVRTIRLSEKAVKFYKHGSGIRWTYEFARRSQIEIILPYAARVKRELELSKVREATRLLINGDGVVGAAPVVNQSSYNTPVGVTAVNGTIMWEHLLYWLVQRAKAGVPVDTVLMNWDGWFKWNMLFAQPVAGPSGGSFSGHTANENLSAAGVNLVRQAVAMNLNVTPVLSSTVAAGTLIGITKGETLEELVEANSNIQETEQAVSNQTMSMYLTENTGFRLVFGDTRSVFNFAG